MGNGQWVVVMGLCPATFQRCLNIVLRPLIGKCCLVYIDDIVLFSKSYEDHLEDLKQVFTLLRQAGLKIKLSKCEFVRQFVKYLGHVVSQHGVQPDPEKVAAISKIGTPDNVGKPRSLLGMFSYYRKLIRNYSEITHPLTQLTKQDTIWKWGACQQKAMELLLGHLVVSSILWYPDFSRRFKVFTEECEYGIGAVLAQDQPNEKTTQRK